MPLALKKDQHYTYSDYKDWPENERWEIINGIAYNMSPAPSRKHQEVLGEIFAQFFQHFKEKPCKVYMAPFDVRFPKGNEKEEKINTVVQPDILVVCNEKKLDEKGCIGAPDLIVEIISPGTASKDMKEKFELYEKQAVKEYWIVHPEEKLIMVFSLNSNGEYGKPKVFSESEKLQVDLFPELKIDLTFFD